MPIRVLILFLFSFNYILAQTLNLPARSNTALNGTQFVATISSGAMSLTTRENLIYAEVSSGNVPNFFRNLVPVTSSGLVNGVTQSVTYYVIPDYLAIGHDTDYFLCPMSPMLATRIGNLTSMTLPTRKMVNDIYAAASLKLSPSTIPPSGSMTTVPVFDQHNTTVRGQRNAVIASFPLGSLVGGDKKDVVITNQIYTTANRVVIYGWHTAVGSPIQPLSNVHADTYMDYSHGIRLIQNAVIYNGTPTTIEAILQSSTLNALLSDEGVISQPWYPYYQPLTSLNTPSSFAVIQNTSTSLKLKVTVDANVTDYKVYLSTDGINFNTPIQVPVSNLTITGLNTNQIYFVKIAAFNSTNNITSGTSELLGAVTSSINDSNLIVNGFDRASTGNTYNFIKQHGYSFYYNQKGFSSATNEAISSNLININNYKIADYILGEESTANETFSNAEQTIISDYLKQGGHLFVSGSEIAWDLDHLGSLSDQAFFHDYLKATYIEDAPMNTASVYYTGFTSSLNNTIFTSDSILFDNGTHGTYNVDYPDVIAATNGSDANLHYSNSLTSIAGIHYTGMFNGGTKSGKLVYLCFPFETIYDASNRDTVMKNVIDYFEGTVSTVGVNELSSNFEFKIYPNPCADFLYVDNTNNYFYNYTITDMLGKTNISGKLTRGFNSISMLNLSNGIYFINVWNQNNFKTIRFVIEH